MHFDIQTGGPQPAGSNGPDAMGQDGQAWTCELQLFAIRPIEM